MKNNFRIKFSRSFGLILLIIGLVLNQYVLQGIFTDDNEIHSSIHVAIIWIFDSICIIVGAIIIFKKGILFSIKIKDFVFTIIIFFIFLFILEIGMRIFFQFKYSYNQDQMDYEDKLGWQTKPNKSVKYHINGYGEITYTTTENGFRVYGDPRTSKTKIFVLGDSFTHANSVSDDSTYYDYLENNNDDIEIFSYGGGGYGSLQEYLVLDMFFDDIKPDIILWQFSTNDWINNDHTLESLSYSNNNKMTRPYLIDGKIEYKYPKVKGGIIYDMLSSFFIFRMIDIRFSILIAKQREARLARGESIESSLHIGHPLFINAFNTTSKIFDMIKNRIGDVPIVLFSVDNNFFYDSIRELCIEKNIKFIDGVPEKIKEASKDGIRINGLPYDSHWNAKGHEIAGKVILKFLNTLL